MHSQASDCLAPETQASLTSEMISFLSLLIVSRPRRFPRLR
jgi:hypothetical protein